MKGVPLPLFLMPCLQKIFKKYTKGKKQLCMINERCNSSESCAQELVPQSYYQHRGVCRDFRDHGISLCKKNNVKTDLIEWGGVGKGSGRVQFLFI